MKQLVAVTALALLSLSSLGTASAQTANSSPTSGSGAAGTVSRTAPSGGTAQPAPGTPQIGAPTPLERHEEKKSEKAVDICKGC